MKKLLAFLMLTFVCLLTVGCSAVKKAVEEAQNQESGKATPTEGGEPTPAVKPTEGGQTGGSNKDEVKSHEEVARLIGDKYLITIKLITSYRESSGETVEDSIEYTTVSDGTYSYWGTTLEDLSRGSLYKRCDDSSLASYDFDEEAGGYTEMAIFPTEINPFRSVNAIFLVETEIEYTSKSAITFLGRECTKYEYKVSESTIGGSATYERTWIMDNATGACLKYDAAVAGSGLDYSGAASANFEVTQFEQGSKVDEIIKKITDKIFIKEWDSEVFEKLGLTKDSSSYELDDILKSATIERSSLQLREASNEVYADTGNGTYSIVYFANLSQVKGEELVKAIINNIYDCGAQFDSDGTYHSSALEEPLCYYENDGGASYSFYATPGAGDYYVEIDGRWNPYLNEGTWVIELTIYYHN